MANEEDDFSRMLTKQLTLLQIAMCQIFLTMKQTILVNAVIFATGQFVMDFVMMTK